MLSLQSLRWQKEGGGDRIDGFIHSMPQPAGKQRGTTVRDRVYQPRLKSEEQDSLSMLHHRNPMEQSMTCATLAATLSSTWDPSFPPNLRYAIGFVIQTSIFFYNQETDKIISCPVGSASYGCFKIQKMYVRHGQKQTVH